jgi:5'-nucleotidase
VIAAVQEYALGSLNVILDDSGRVLNFTLREYPVVACANDSVPTANCTVAHPEWQKRVNVISDAYTASKSYVIANTSVVLPSRDGCYNMSCSSGQLMTRAMKHVQPQCEISMTNTGGIRGSNLPPGPITRGDIENLFPFSNYVSTVQMTGRTLLDVLRNSFTRAYPLLDGLAGVGRFLQVHGVDVRFVMNRTRSDFRLLDAWRVLDNGSRAEIEPFAVYTVCMPDFMANGGDGFTMNDEYISVSYSCNSLHSVCFCSFGIA